MHIKNILHGLFPKLKMPTSIFIWIFMDDKYSFEELLLRLMHKCLQITEVKSCTIDLWTH